MLEFLEMHRILGVEHITMYNHTIGPAVDCILEDYKVNSLSYLSLPFSEYLTNNCHCRKEVLSLFCHGSWT